MRNAALPIDWGLVATPFSTTRYRVCPPGGGGIYIYIRTSLRLFCVQARPYRGISRLVLVVGRMRRDKFRDRSNGDTVSMLLPFAFSTFDTNPFVPSLLSLFISFLGYVSSTCSFLFSSFFGIRLFPSFSLLSKIGASRRMESSLKVFLGRKMLEKIKLNND